MPVDCVGGTLHAWVPPINNFNHTCYSAVSCRVAIIFGMLLANLLILWENMKSNAFSRYSVSFIIKYRLKFEFANSIIRGVAYTN